jgi:hypothetical protein
VTCDVVAGTVSLIREAFSHFFVRWLADRMGPKRISVRIKVGQDQFGYCLFAGKPYLLTVLKNKAQYGSTDTRGLEMCVRQRETVVGMGVKLGLSHLERNID